MALLELRGLTAHYGDLQALFGVDLELAEGETVAIIGANGAGKTTMMLAISGLITSASSEIVFDGREIGSCMPEDAKSLGIAIVPEGRRLFSSLSVEENLLIGTHGRKKSGGYWNLERVYDLFPAIAEFSSRQTVSLSGGQQQMVAIGRALLANPRLLLCDEISLGLAPVVIRDIYACLPVIKEAGATVMLVEQDITQAVECSDRLYCMMEGRVTLSGKSGEVSRDSIRDAYFGMSQ